MADEAPRYFGEMQKKIKGSDYDDAKLKSLLAGLKVEALAAAESLLAQDGATEDAAGAAALRAELAAMGGVLEGGYDALTRLQAVRRAVADTAEQRLVAPDYAAALDKRVAELKPSGKNDVNYKRDRAELDAAIVKVVGGGSRGGDEDDVVATMAGGGDATLRIKCPITRVRMKDPVRNAGCSHVYERSAIEQMRTSAAKRGKPEQCPVCKKPLTELVADEDTLYLINEDKRKREADGEDGDEDGARGGGGGGGGGDDYVDED